MLQPIIDFFVAFANWLVKLFGSFLEALKGIFLWMFEQVLEAIRAVITAIPVPDLLHNSMQGAVDGFLPLTSYLLGQSGVAQGLMLLGAAYVFRILRKFATLFQW